jgi:6-phosphofructokinase
MNGVVRAAARTEFSLGWEVLDVADGFSGLTSGPFRPLILQERPDSGVVCRQVLG